ncbi:D-2-hydroxyacid dehydrogenase family protein [Marinobacterium lutimaris]|uniref:D-3-phosphoglycerate dehydrogenase n=1 Tax=Marinobacterium lutimaris TaxID=568106 RepID=A0A1H5TQU4_9GAMM|nr:D-2-hydroxyacid dehydrogenase family protein [Marinobacterium lutimaris]SEF64451.1 D-3-phosphoglycerate dehydrogenase [Marinobacterium lutimaris]
MKIAVLDDYQDAVRSLDCYPLLAEQEVLVLNQTYSDPADLATHLQGVEALVLIRERTQISEALLKLLPDLKVISQTGKISNHIDPALCEKYGIEILEGRGSPVAPSELCWSLILAASRHLPAYVANLDADNWQQSGPLGLGRTLEGLQLGIWGYGKIGQRIARYADAFGMNICVWGSETSRQKAEEDGYTAADSKAEFFRSSDVLSLHLRLNDATRGIVTRTDLAQMKADSLFVNISRAELVEPGALLAELQQHPSKRAALDVFDSEPATPSTDPLLALPNALCTPHIGYVEKNSYELYFRIAFENLLGWIEQRHSDGNA